MGRSWNFFRVKENRWIAQRLINYFKFSLFRPFGLISRDMHLWTERGFY